MPRIRPLPAIDGLVPDDRAGPVPATTTDYPNGVVYSTDTTIAAGDEVTAPTVDITPPSNTAHATLVINGTIRVGSDTAQESYGINVGSVYTPFAGVVNNGLITSTAGGPKEVFGIYNNAGLPVINNGTIIAHMLGEGSAGGIYSYFHGGSITNSGRIEATADHGSATGISNKGLAETITNSGQIVVRAGVGAHGPGYATGIDSGQTAGMMLNNSGLIDVGTGGPYASVGIALFPDSTNINVYGTVINSGTIIADHAIVALNGYLTSLHVTNSGHIQGDLLFETGDNIVVNTAGATWAGLLSLGLYQDIVVNAGTITGDVTLGKGADQFDGRGGTVSGSVGGGDGLDILWGGDAADRLDGGADGDVLIGGGGADRLTGGSGADAFGYVAFADSTAGARDTITDFQSGVDRIDLRGLGDVTVSIGAAGGVSTVTATGAGGTLVVDVTGSVTLADIVTGTPGHTLTGTAGADVLWGAASGAAIDGLGGDDLIVGTAGNDTIDGGTGGDTMEGGAGDDVYYIDDYNDRALELDGGGYDEIRTSVGYLMPHYIEKLTLTGSDAIDATGNTDANLIIGNDAANALAGRAGDDVLIGNGGGDTLQGDGGADRFVYLLPSDATVAAPDKITGFEHGIDLVDVSAIPVTGVLFAGTTLYFDTAPGTRMAIQIDASTTIADVLLPNQVNGTAAGDTLATGDTGGALVGLAGDDVLTGGAGNDFLEGGAGVDRMSGGAGNDFYFVDRADDLTFEAAGGGTDTVFADAGVYLYANVENLTLMNAAGAAFGVGNELDNVLTGNRSDNLLIAGAGADLVTAGAGNDSLYGQDGADHLYGEAGIDYLVGGNGNDTLDGGADADALYGEAGDDVLTGGSDFKTDILVGGDGNDVLHGDSGLADYDLMDGGAGDDIFYVDTGNDQTFEAANGGTDTVYANVYGDTNGVYLYANVENLVLLGTTRFGVGNELANQLTGNATTNLLLGGAGNDVINGKQGNDVLFGEAGSDTFVFEHGTGGDVIGDFTAGTDRIDLTAIGYSWAQVQNAFHQNGSDLAIDLGGGDLVVLQGVTASQLHQSDFILAGGAAAVAPAAGDTADPIAAHQLWHGHGDVMMLAPLL